jgi:hypothetical protein
LETDSEIIEVSSNRYESLNDYKSNLASIKGKVIVAEDQMINLEIIKS